MEKIIEFAGPQAGPTSIIIAGIHGNEKCGVEALKEILPTLKIEQGRVFIGYGNPRAIEQGVRFTETNLNRMFKSDENLTIFEKGSYEYERAQYLKKYLDQADVLLDIHASSNPESRQFVICEPNANEIVQCLPINLVASGFDHIQPGGTDYYMNINSKVGICVECGYLDNPSSIIIAKESIVEFLRARGHISGDTKTFEQSHIHVYNMYLTRTAEFKLAKSFADFENMEEGQLIGVDGNNEIYAPKNGVILFAHDRNKTGEEAFLLGEHLFYGDIIESK